MNVVVVFDERWQTFEFTTETSGCRLGTIARTKVISHSCHLMIMIKGVTLNHTRHGVALI